jgi:4-hydroxy-tetrahydrodipicolinate reductase
MKIALLGYGKMGREIEKIAIGHGHTIRVTFDNESDWKEKAAQLKECDVAIEFSMPSIVVENILKCFEAGIPVVVGTTGWYDQFEFISERCTNSGGTLFYATNFSIGVYIFSDINRRLAALLQNYPMYSPSMIEIHHTQKLDAPSGTAISLAKEIIAENSRFTKYSTVGQEPAAIPIESVRKGNVPGSHTITWKSDIDQITITHEAFNRRGLALGAVTAASWIHGRKGIFTMKDMLDM